MNTVLSVSALLLATVTAIAAATVGFRYDGGGFWPDADPPVAWDDSGKNTAWKVKLSTWGNGEPIVVGNRIYLVNDLDWWDFDRVAPSLLCLDPKDGSVIWERELDHTTVLPPAQAKQAKADWITLRKKYHEGWQICSEIAKEFGPGKQADQAAEERLGKVGLGLHSCKTTWSIGVNEKTYRDLQKKLKAANFWSLAWSQPNGQWCGVGYPTPVSDGEHIFVRTGYAAAFCYKLDGTHVWTSIYKAGADANQQSWCPSPVLADGVLVIADAQNQHGFDAVGLDAKTGKELWRVEPWKSWIGYPLGGCLVLEVDGKKVVHLPSGRLIRPRDGRILAEGLGRAENTCCTGAGDLLVVPFWSVKAKKPEEQAQLNKLYPWLPEKEGLVGYRLAWDGPDRITPTRLWTFDSLKLDTSSPVLAGGLVFVPGRSEIVAIDVASGKLVAKRSSNDFGRPSPAWNLAVASGKLFVIGFEKGDIAVLSADRDLKVLATNPPIGRPQAEVPLPWGTWRIEAGKGKGKPWGPAISQSGPVTFAGKRAYVRAWRYLYCFEN